jgi:hypothetical protein
MTPTNCEALQVRDLRVLARRRFGAVSANLSTCLLDALYQFEGSPAIQSLLLAAHLLLTGSLMCCVKVLIFKEAEPALRDGGNRQARNVGKFDVCCRADPRLTLGSPALPAHSSSVVL